VSDKATEQLDAFLTPGTLLRTAREALQLSQREVADLLHLMPGYPAIIERDDYRALRHPAFARGYVKAYGKLVGVDEQRLLAAYDRLRAAEETPEPRTVRTRPPQLQHTGLGVIIGLVLLVLLVVAIWWWRAVPAANAQASQPPAGDSGEVLLDRNDSMTGER